MDRDLIQRYPGEDEFSFLKRKVYFARLVKHRLDYSDKRFEVKKNHLTPITSDEKEEIDTFWGEFLSEDLRDKIVDYRYYDFFKNIMSPGEQLSQYVNNLFYAFIDEYYSNPQYSNSCDDKNLYDLYFYDVNRPKTVFRKLRSVFLDESYQEINLNEAIKRAKDCEEVILKVGKFGYGGKNLMFWNSTDSDEQELLDFLQNNNNIICQEIITQHAELSRLNPTSVNTLRIMTLFFEGQVYYPSSVLRMGIDDSRVDNGSQGGIVCGIQADGRLKNFARNLSGDTYTQHPRGARFETVVIPNFGGCIDLATSLAKRFVDVSRSISWDFAIDEKGQPLLVEFNLAGGGLDVHQVCNGPLYGDLYHDVVADVCKNSYTLKSIIRSMQ